MKNIKQLLVAAIALVSASSMANLAQPHVATTEDAPMRVTAGLQGGLLKNDNGFGVNNLGLALGFTHNVGYDFEYGLAVGGNWATPEYDRGGRLFMEESKKASGVRIETELLARFMPEIADSFRLGGLVSVGWSNQFGGEALKKVKDSVAFGDLAVRAGLATSYGLTDMVAVYFAPSYALTQIRFAASKATEAQKKDIKEGSNLSGLELPVGLWFATGDNVGLYLEANTRFRNFKQFTKTWKEDITLGVSFAM